MGKRKKRIRSGGRGSGGRSWGYCLGGCWWWGFRGRQVVCRSSWLNQSITIEFEVFTVVVEMGIAMFTCYAGYVF